MSTRSTAVIAAASGRQREGWDDPGRGNATWFTLFSSDRTPTTAMSAGLMDIPPNGGGLEPHRHQQAEIYFVHEGTGLLTVDGVETQLTTGMSAFIPGDAEHSLRNHAPSVLKIFYVFPADSFADVIYRFR
jgi:mannose-6-phosphate isomerase-like protein (cupin superfamily)